MRIVVAFATGLCLVPASISKHFLAPAAPAFGVESTTTKLLRNHPHRLRTL
jgi:hypothetical protein